MTTMKNRKWLNQILEGGYRQTTNANLNLMASKKNKTRGLRRWPKRVTIVLRCNKFDPGSTDIYEFQFRTSQLFVTSVPTSQECVHKNSERYLIQSWGYPIVCQISSRKYANYQTDRHKN